MKLYQLNRPVHTVFIHCSASDNPKHDNIKTIRSWHADRGFNDVGYHYFIQSSGNIQKGRDLEKIPAAQKGYNTGSIAICLHGLTTFTEEQFEALRELCHAINDAYAWKDVKIRFRGHCEVSSKTCPVFDYKTVLNLDDFGWMNAKD